MDLVDKSNITGHGLGKKGLHLNVKSTKIFAMNLIAEIRKFWNKKVTPEDKSYSEECESCFIQTVTNIPNLNETIQLEENDQYSDDTSNTPCQILKNIRLKNPNRIIIAQLNINSIRNKFNILSSIITNKIDILMISETKLDASFPNNQFTINGFTAPYRLDRNANGGGILLYIREDIP